MLKQYLTFIFLTVYASITLFASELDNVYNLGKDRAKINAKAEYRHKVLYEKGITSKGAHLNVDKKYRKEARKLESKRQKAVAAIFEKAGVKAPAQMGTDPRKSRGILSDIDTANMSKSNVKKLADVVKAHNQTPGVKNKYTLSNKYGYIQIKELDITVFKKIKNPDNHVFSRGANKETALAIRTTNSGDTDNLRAYKLDKNGNKTPLKTNQAVITDKHMYNLDNMKKLDGDLSKTNLKKVNFQNAGKSTMRIIENTYGKNLEKIKDPVKKAKMQKLLDQSRTLKKDSASSAGLHNDAQKRDYMKRAKKSIIEAYKQQAGTTERGLAKQCGATKRRMQDLKKQLAKSKWKNPVLKAELDANKKFFKQEKKILRKYRQKRLAAERGIIKNGGAELLAEAKGQKVKKIKLSGGGTRYISLDDGSVSSKSQLEDKLTRKQRRKIAPVSKIKTTVSTNTPRIKTTVATSATFHGSLYLAGTIVGMHHTYKTAEYYLPKDLDPTYRKGLKTAITIASATQLGQAALTGVMVGGNSGLDSMAKWYQENPGREPTRWEMNKAGMRGANNYILYDLPKTLAHGFFVQPFKDVYNIGHGLGDAIYQRKKAAIAVRGAQAKDKEVSSKYRSQFDKLKKHLANLDKITEQIDKDPLSQPAERTLATKIKSESKLAKKVIHNSTITAMTRNDELQVTKKIKDPKTGKMQEVIVKSKTSIEERRAAVGYAASYVARVDKMVRKLIAMRNSCDLRIKLFDSITGKALTNSSWMTVGSGKYKAAPRGTSILQANKVPGGTCKVKVHATGYETSKDFSIKLDAIKSRSYTFSIKMKPAEESPIYAEFTLIAIDAKTKKTIPNVSFRITNKQRKINFSSPSGAMKVKLEVGSCKAYASAKGYKSGSTTTTINTSASSNKNIYIRLSKSSSKKYTKRRKLYMLYFKAEHPEYNITMKSSDYKINMVRISDNVPVKVRTSRPRSARAEFGKYKVTLSGKGIKPSTKTFDFNKHPMTASLLIKPLFSPLSYDFTFKLPKIDKMVDSEKVDSFRKSQDKKKILFTISHGGHMRIRLKAVGHGSVGVRLVARGKISGLGLAHSRKYKDGHTRSNTKYYSLWDEEKGKQVVAYASIYNLKLSRKSDYDAQDRVTFLGGSFSGNVVYSPLPFKEAKGRRQMSVKH